MPEIKYVLIGFDYRDGVHTETVYCTGSNTTPRETLDSFKHFSEQYMLASASADARILRDSDQAESDRIYRAFDGWRRMNDEIKEL